MHVFSVVRRSRATRVGVARRPRATPVQDLSESDQPSALHVIAPQLGVNIEDLVITASGRAATFVEIELTRWTGWEHGLRPVCRTARPARKTLAHPGSDR